MKKTKITHLIVGLDGGGAEIMLYKLLKNISLEKYDVQVISMMDKGIFGDRIISLGIELHTLNMNRGKISINGFFKLLRLLKDTDILQTWMYHADLLGFICGKLNRIPKIIWGIHHSNLNKKENKSITILIAKLNAILSNYVYKIISCSLNATEVHTKIGYNNKKIVTIPNGFDLNSYKKNESAKLEIAKELNLLNSEKLIIHVARWHKLKDYDNLLSSIAILKKHIKNFTLIMCGTNIDNNNIELLEMVKKYEVEDNVLLLGRREDIPTIMSSGDIFVSSSSGEGFPNVIGEAMSCETPCVVTDVGDCSYIVGDTGFVVNSKDSDSLAVAMYKLLNMEQEERLALGRKARERVLEHFEIKRIAKKYESLY